MSRSWKNVYGDSDRNPFMKNQANRRVRKISVNDSIPDGCSYKKYFCSYDICDFKSFDYTERQFRDTFRRWSESAWFRNRKDFRILSDEDLFRKEANRSRSK